MPLKIRVKPESKFFAGGAVLKNVGTRAADLLILSDGPVLREDYMMNPDRMAESDAASSYFLLQLMYLFKGKGQKFDSLVMDTLRNFAKLYPDLSASVDEITGLLEKGDTYKALKIAHGLMDNAAGKKPVNGMTIAAVPTDMAGAAEIMTTMEA